MKWRNQLMSYKVIDDYLPKQEFENIKNIIVNDDLNFPWYYNKFLNNRDYGEINDHFYFVHVVYNKYLKNSDYFDDLLPLITKINPKALIRIKANAYPKNGNDIIKHGSHTDYDFSHKGAIFYLNTNNGKTILEDDTKIDSIENRILFFDASKPHSSTNCTDAKMRFNINVNYF